MIGVTVGDMSRATEQNLGRSATIHFLGMPYGLPQPVAETKRNESRCTTVVHGSKVPPYLGRYLADLSSAQTFSQDRLAMVAPPGPERPLRVWYGVERVDIQNMEIGPEPLAVEVLGPPEGFSSDSGGNMVRLYSKVMAECAPTLTATRRGAAFSPRRVTRA